MRPDDLHYIQETIHRLAAVRLNDDKAPIIRARLTQLISDENLPSIPDLIARLRTGDLALIDRVVDCVLNHETSFFRDIYPFNALRQHIIPHLIQAQQKTRSLHIWCAACSTGQEPFSLSMLLREHFPALASWTVNLFASDISAEVIKQAKLGSYNQFEVSRGLPTPLLLKYFRQDANHWLLSPDIIQSVRFFRHNLQDPWPFPHRVDLILLRNALIYFEPATRCAIFEKVYQGLYPHGALLLGSAETTLNYSQKFEMQLLERAAFYRPLPCTAHT